MSKTAPTPSPPLSQESEKLIKMKNRKMKKQAQKDVKNVKQVIVTEGVTDEYNIDNILEELGESQVKKKPTNKKSNSKKKADRKGSGNKTINGKKDKCSGDKLEHDAADDPTGAVEEDNEELVEQSQSNANGQEHISSTNQTVLPELASQAAMLNQQTSESTEDMFTPVISKNSKRRNKKVGISNLSKDDLAQTSSSLTSSTTSSAMAASSSQNTSYSAPVISKQSKEKNKKAGISNLNKEDLAQTSSSLTSSAMAASSGQNTSHAASSYSSILSAKPSNVEILNVKKFEDLIIVEEETSKLECKICFDSEVSQIFQPCGHSICCNKCAIGLRICPICRGNIQKSQTIYFS